MHDLVNLDLRNTFVFVLIIIYLDGWDVSGGAAAVTVEELSIVAGVELFSLSSFSSVLVKVVVAVVDDTGAGDAATEDTVEELHD